MEDLKNLSFPATNFSIGDTEAIKCKCGNAMFDQVFLLRKLSRLKAGTAKDVLSSIPIWCCNACGTILPGFIPKEIESEFSGVKKPEPPPTQMIREGEIPNTGNLIKM